MCDRLSESKTWTIPNPFIYVTVFCHKSRICEMESINVNQDQLLAILKVVGPIIVTWLAANGVKVPETVTPAAIVGLVGLGASVWAAFSHSDKAKILAAAALPHIAKIVVKQDAPPSSAAGQMAADSSQPKVSKTQ